MTSLHIPMRAVCAAYGLNANTLRTWERRYGFPVPARGAGGQRTYAPEDVEAIGRMAELVKGGMSPADAVAAVRTAAPAAGAGMPQKELSSLHRALVKAAERIDFAEMRRLTLAALHSMGYASFIEKLGFPVLAELGHAWESSGSGIAVEHGYTLVLECLVLGQALKLELPENAPTLTIACVPEELHQLPTLHLANLVVEHALAKPLVLTAGLPIAEILSASIQQHARFIVLSATMTPSAAATRLWMDECMRAGWGEKIVLAGPGFMRSRVYADYPVRAAAGGFAQTITLLRGLLSAQSTDSVVI